MSLTDGQIPNLIDNFHKFWKAPDGFHVASRRSVIGGELVQTVCVMCPPDDEPYGAKEFWLLDRVLTSGLAAAAKIQ